MILAGVVLMAVAVILIFGGFIWLSRQSKLNNAQLKESFSALSFEALSKSMDQFFKIANETLSKQAEGGGRELEAKKKQMKKKDTIALETDKGTIKLKIFPAHAPLACENFIALVEQGYYNGITFHRVIKDFMIQSGDPTGTGAGGKSAIFGKAPPQPVQNAWPSGFFWPQRGQNMGTPHLPFSRRGKRRYA